MVPTGTGEGRRGQGEGRTREGEGEGMKRKRTREELKGPKGINAVRPWCRSVAQSAAKPSPGAQALPAVVRYSAAVVVRSCIPCSPAHHLLQHTTARPPRPRSSHVKS